MYLRAKTVTLNETQSKFDFGVFTVHRWQSAMDHSWPAGSCDQGSAVSMADFPCINFKHEVLNIVVTLQLLIVLGDKVV